MLFRSGFFRQKSRSLIGMAGQLVRDHNGEVPRSMDALTALPGVGRKTANVVLGHAFGVPGLPVDRYVLRVVNRLGLARSDDPVKVESALCELLPPNRWTRSSDTLILHGRRVCRPVPLCQRCHARADCDFARSGTTTNASKRPARIRKPAARTRPRDRKSTRLNSSHIQKSRMPSSA